MFSTQRWIVSSPIPESVALPVRAAYWRRKVSVTCPLKQGSRKNSMYPRWSHILASPGTTPATPGATADSFSSSPETATSAAGDA
eukprot:CAMPEP_0118978278 /NCGR_PEP_ID=MMETSP1173-20130426/23302_1 /TAXON_ID=1034831 /ORGANISM="Rhizochromulina marina cf, Strain CCMP1243" /LENGTH=84 /DNA_ID=CAMNT_0006928463 /DNA_START=1 /DNA_END=255 /DNA_ORIENTATION=-